jgi:serine/threonine protein kinase
LTDESAPEYVERPDAVGDYDLLEELGRGGMGVVYRARQKSLDRQVALKMLLAGSFASQETVTRFRFEATAVARLQHPNIVQIHEVGDHAGHPFFSMEYVDGGSLAGRMQDNSLNDRDSARLCRLLARAIHHAHERGIIHRDLKPGNILLQRVGSSPQRAIGRELPSSNPPGIWLVDGDYSPKITDFGIAKQLTDETLGTASGVVMGTPSFMSPEQAAGFKDLLSPATDIYALGAILYNLLTGRPPFLADSIEATLELVRRHGPMMPRRLRPDISRDAQTICMKCLEKEPHRRYATALALAEDLERFLEGKPILARPASGPERVWKWIKRRPLAAALIAVSWLAFAALLMGSVALFYNSRLNEALEYAESARARAEAQEQEATQQRKTAEKEARKTGAVTRILVDGFSDEDPLGLNGNFIMMPRERGESWTLLEVLRLATLKNSRRLEEDPSVRAQVQETVGTALRNLGHYEEAEERLKEALRLRRDAESPSSAEIAAGLHSLGLLYHQWGRYAHGDYEKARSHYEEAVRLRRQLQPPNELVVSESLFQLAWLHVQNEEFKEAEDLFRQVREIRARPEVHASIREKLLVEQGLVGLKA